MAENSAAQQDRGWNSPGLGERILADTERGRAEGGRTRHVIDLDESLLGRAQAALGTATFRETIARATALYLDQIVEGLKQLGVVARPSGKRRPRNIDDETWAALARAEGEVSLELIQLLRACVVLAGRSGTQNAEGASMQPAGEASMQPAGETSMQPDAVPRMRPAELPDDQ